MVANLTERQPAEGVALNDDNLAVFNATEKNGEEAGFVSKGLHKQQASVLNSSHTHTHSLSLSLSLTHTFLSVLSSLPPLRHPNPPPYSSITKMGRYDDEGSYEAAIEALNALLLKCPQLKPAASKKIDELTRELSLEAKLHQEANDVKQELSKVAHELDPVDKLKNGFQTFKTYFKKEHEMFKSLAESQHPKFMIIACADSRVDPCTILGLGVGEAFVVRNVANMVEPYFTKGGYPSTSAAIEYAVLHLKVEHLMVIGHSRCGGIKALMGIKPDGSNRFSEFIEDWVHIGKPISSKVKDTCGDVSFEEQCTACEKEAVNHSLYNCLTFPFVKDAVAKEKLTLHGAHYDFVNGSFELWNVHYKVSEVQKFE